MKLLDSVVITLVYVLLTISMFGVIFINETWKEIGYLFITLLMLDILYKRYYNKKNAGSNRN